MNTNCIDCNNSGYLTTEVDIDGTLETQRCDSCLSFENDSKAIEAYKLELNNKAISYSATLNKYGGVYIERSK